MIELIDNFLKTYIGWILLFSWIGFGVCLIGFGWEGDDDE